MTPPEYIDDPLVVLEKIVGSSLQTDGTAGIYDTDDEAEGQRPENLIEDVTFGGMSLQDFLHNTKKPEALAYKRESDQLNLQSAEECKYVSLLGCGLFKLLNVSSP